MENWKIESRWGQWIYLSINLQWTIDRCRLFTLYQFKFSHSCTETCLKIYRSWDEHRSQAPCLATISNYDFSLVAANHQLSMAKNVFAVVGFAQTKESSDIQNRNSYFFVFCKTDFFWNWVWNTYFRRCFVSRGLFMNLFLVSR